MCCCVCVVWFYLSCSKITCAFFLFGPRCREYAYTFLWDFINERAEADCRRHSLTIIFVIDRWLCVSILNRFIARGRPKGFKIVVITRRTTALNLFDLRAWCFLGHCRCVFLIYLHLFLSSRVSLSFNSYGCYTKNVFYYEFIFISLSFKLNV